MLSQKLYTKECKKYIMIHNIFSMNLIRNYFKRHFSAFDIKQHDFQWHYVN
jgi:hypothetical protein